MWIKICANTNLEDVLLAADLGADAVGFVFAPSSRQITPAQAAAMVSRLPGGLETVGVFPGWSANRIVEAVEQANLTSIQLHDTPDSDCIRTLHAHFGKRIAIIQVIHWNVEGGGGEAERIARQMERIAAMPEVHRILIDSKAGSKTGGTGAPFPWREAKSLFAANPKTILAGGLNPNNVGEAVEELRPWGVDVASGVEASPGKKDPVKLRTFLQAARNAGSN